MQYSSKINDLAPAPFEDDDDWLEEYLGPKQKFKRRRRPSVFDQRHEFYTKPRKKPINENSIVLFSKAKFNIPKPEKPEEVGSESSGEDTFSETSAHSLDSSIVGLEALDTSKVEKFSSESEDDPHMRKRKTTKKEEKQGILDKL